MFKSIDESLREAKRVLFLTGAGLSQESGLATFRGAEGLWKKYDPTKLATPDAFYDDPKLVWEWYYERRKKVLIAQPNAGHQAIAKIENLREVQVVTQNIDGLHQTAGSKNVLELHGNIFRTRCTVCEFRGDMADTFPPPPPLCEKCSNILRPDVVLFGEPIAAWQEAVMQAGKCDIMCVVGTSLMVSPANQLPLYAKEHGAILVEINPEPTPYSDIMDLSLRSTAVEALPKLLPFITNGTD
jgi:NAD-dependent deacetylase